MKHLLSQIAAPMASFGNESARRDRPTDDHMRKSGFLGLLGAAAGKTRADPWHSTISQALGFAVMVLRAGKRMVDYQVALSPTGSKTYGTRREEAQVSDYSTESYREYIVDFPYSIAAVWQRPDGPPADLDGLASALESPVFEVYVGRKCCTLCLPMAPRILDMPTLADAFRAYKEILYKPLLGDEKTFRVHWENHPASGLTSVGVIQVRDDLVDRQRWLFRNRTENEGSITL